MSLYGMMRTGVSGMQAQATKLSTIEMGIRTIRGLRTLILLRCVMTARQASMSHVFGDQASRKASPDGDGLFGTFAHHAKFMRCDTGVIHYIGNRCHKQY